MESLNWQRECPVSITVCDRDGIILEMNGEAEKVFAQDGGAALVGTNVLACHPEPSRTKLEGLLESGATNIYTIEKGGRKKMICQVPWYQAGELAGLVELAFVLPAELPHFIRDKAAAGETA